jgi:hypothetical protein
MQTRIVKKKKLTKMFLQTLNEGINKWVLLRK